MRQALELALDWIQKQPEETPHSKYDVDTRYVVIREIEASLAQQRTWVRLTDEEMKQTCYEVCSYDPYTIARAIEAKLKDKNERISP